MRSLKTAVVAFMSIAALVGCGGNDPKIYRVFVDTQPIDSTALPTTCWQTGNAPVSSKSAVASFREEQQWTVWQGAEKVQWLDMKSPGGGAVSYKLGDTSRINVIGPIEGAEKAFTGSNQDERLATATDTNTSTDFQSVTVSFEQIDSIAKGSITLLSTFKSNNATETRPASCTGTVTFSGRQVTGSSQINTDL